MYMVLKLEKDIPKTVTSKNIIEGCDFYYYYYFLRLSDQTREGKYKPIKMESMIVFILLAALV